MFDQLVAATCGTSEARALDAWARVESAACARRLAAMVTILDAAHATDGSADREQWCLDNWAAVCAHIGAAQRITSGVASGFLLVGTALRDRFPKVRAVFAEGLIDYRMARTIVYRGLLVTDPDALRALDTALARAVRTWEPMSQDKTEKIIDAFIERFDPHAVRRTELSARSRSLDVTVDDATGVATLFGTLFAHDARAFDARLDAFAATVCPADPRTKDQCRADAAGAMAHGADRLICLCDTEDCPAAQNPPASGVVVYVIAHQDTVDASPNSPLPDNAPTADPARIDDTGDDDGDTDDDDAQDDAQDDGSGGHGNRAQDEGIDANATAGQASADRDLPDRDPVEECHGLDGPPPPRFANPLRDMTLTEVMTTTRPDRSSTIRPGALMGGQLLPGAVTRRATLNATFTRILHPGQAPPEPRYTPSKKLADFVRCRDLTCRFPGCREPATNCDVDHAIAWPLGPTQASNLRCLCRKHHLLKTFWGGDGGWRDHQHPDGTIDWTAPDGRTHTTTPGSRLLFPELSEPTAPVVATDVPERPRHTAGLTMPRRKTTRTHDRARRIADERRRNRTISEHAERESIPPF